MKPEIEDLENKMEILKKYFMSFFGEQYAEQISKTLKNTNLIFINPSTLKNNQNTVSDILLSMFYKHLGYTFSESDFKDLDTNFKSLLNILKTNQVTDELADCYLKLCKYGENTSIKTLEDAKNFLTNNYAQIQSKFSAYERDFEMHFNLVSLDKKEVALSAFESVFGKFNISKTSKFHDYLLNGCFVAFGRERPLEFRYDKQTLDFLTQCMSGKNVSFDELQRDPEFAKKLNIVKEIFTAKMSALDATRDIIIQRECPSFIENTKHLNKQAVEDMKKTILDISVNSSQIAARCTHVIHNSNVESYLFLPSNVDNTTFVHELLHQISARMSFVAIDKNGNSRVGKDSKFGLRLFDIEGEDAFDESKSLNEIVTDFFANEISVAMARNRENIFKMKNDSSSLYSCAFIEFGKVFRDNMDLFKKLYICPASEFSELIDTKSYFDMNKCANTILKALYEKARTYATIDTKDFRQLSHDVQQQLQNIFAGVKQKAEANSSEKNLQ